MNIWEAERRGIPFNNADSLENVERRAFQPEATLLKKAMQKSSSKIEPHCSECDYFRGGNCPLTIGSQLCVERYSKSANLNRK